MEYNFSAIEQKWQAQWEASKAYQVPNESDKPKYYVLDMFPYPSGAGLHVGHPLGYIASDIFARYKRNRGFNVLHPMGYDAFGLPAEQYAIEHGVHPAVSTAKNIDTFRKQLDKIGFCFDWSREVNTSQPGYYKWTQWIFLQLFNSWYNRQSNKTEPIESLIAFLEKEGNRNHPIPNSGFQFPANVKRETEYGNTFTAEEWASFDEKTRQTILMEYRVSYCGYGEVNWCEALGTVLANDEVVNGVSERGGFPVEKKRLRQWYLRITEYADRLLQGLQTVDFSDAMKEMQSNWIGKSTGAEIDFAIKGSDKKLRVYTTRPDTIFGVDFMVIAPELDLVHEIKGNGQEGAVDEYVAYVKSRSERERMAEKKISGVFTGAYAVNPFDGREIPIWISEYVLAGYGTGAIMAVPCGDERDHKFAQHFNIPITNIIGDAYNGEEANNTKDAKLTNSGFLDGMVMRDAIEVVAARLEEMGIGKRKVNFRMRDAAFSRQRYWGEPFPVKWIDGVAYPLSESELPLELPHVDSYGPGPEGEGPLSNIPEWTSQHLETNTMPGYAGSSWYFLRYMDPHNEGAFCDRKASDYWRQVDLYVGGTEHAVGHLLYSRMWTKALYDLGHISFDEPFKKLLNQGMIQGSSRFVFRINGTNTFVSKGLLDAEGKYEGKLVDKLHVDVNIVDGTELDTEAFKTWKPDYNTAEFILEDGKYICDNEVEKMSKSKFNTVNPDNIVAQYGADTFRMYEMFLGPVEMSKPWETKGIEGVHRFIKKLWRLFVSEEKGLIVTTDAPTAAELKVLHKTIKKIEDDIERFSFNTCVSGFMVCVNELSDLKCHKKAVLEQLLVLLTPFAPHVAEELWHQLGNEGSVLNAPFPKFEAQHVAESTKEYPISVNGKLRTTMNIALDAAQPEVEALVLQNEVVQKWLEGKQPKKVIFVKGKMVNLVV
ncbi:leucyl-tRNA synthetase [Cnuella takakiae]|uniref:Leucine--tRNA ligase n=1 Tax=Cnuella takakiae TaxID=1302690 RepID=A0A1M5DBJ2_9BACT|nr:leucine--tRNA ligase [Cnuella takakiae]OLY94033.1 leucine--tRNA ligase [Cnuella takakiae]SHF64300.1 leucyl-tRNA synthetase [Cnuella takakiae]